MGTHSHSNIQSPLHLPNFGVTKNVYYMKRKTFLLVAFFILATISVLAQEITIQDKLGEMAKAPNPKKVLKLFKETVKQFQLNKVSDTETFDMMYGTLALSNIMKQKIKAYEQNIGMIQNKFNQTSYMNMAAVMLSNNTQTLVLAKSIAEKTLQLYYSFKNDTTARPLDFDPISWKRFMEMAKYPYHETYAKVLNELNLSKEALLQQEIAIKGQQIEELGQTSAELYANILIANNRNQDAYKVLKRMAELDRASDKMITQLKNLHEGLTGDKADKMLDSIKQNLRLAYQQKMLKKIIKDTKAPSFTLQNLNGIHKSLEDYKDKVVVIDFWATWCVPCIQSMPVMDQMRKNNPDVAFLFIATQEKPNGALERVKSFIEKNQYQFEVLLDLVDGKYPTVTDYKISGIPAKIIIDASGNLLFSSIGFTNESNLVNELQAMIDIAKGKTQYN